MSSSDEITEPMATTSSNGSVNVQNSFSIHALYADAGVSASLVILFSLKFAFCLFCSATNLDLAYVTWKNLKSLSGSCNILIGFSGLANGLMAMNSIFGLLVTASGRNFIPVFQCTLGQTIFLWAFFCSSGIALLIGIDRLLAVSAPFWYLTKENDLLYKKIYLAFGLTLCAIYAAIFVAIAYRASFSKPDSPVICALADPMMDKILFVIIFLEVVSVLTVLCYLAIWLIMKLRKMNNDQNRAIFKSLFLIICMEVVGWTTYYFIRTILSPITAIFKLEPLDIWLVMNAYSCIPYIAVGISPLILYKYNKEYRHAFQRQWRKSSAIVGSVVGNGGLTVKEMSRSRMSMTIVNNTKRRSSTITAIH